MILLFITCLAQAPSWKDTQLKHAVCGGFLHFLNELKKIAPSKDYLDMKKQLTSQFAFNYLDSDIQHVLETQVPPGCLAGVSAFRRGFHLVC